MHVNATYTTIAHLWLIKQMVNAKEWRFVTDQDQSLMTSIYRVFAKEINLVNAHHFLCTIDKTKSRKDAYSEYVKAVRDLKFWGSQRGYEDKSLYELVYLKLCEDLQSHRFYEMVREDDSEYPKWVRNPLNHPLATIDRGYRLIDCTTDLTSYETEDVAKLMLNVNDNSTNAFMQQIRRRISILEAL